MLSGRADAEAHAAGAPTLADFDVAPVLLGNVAVVQVLYEVKGDVVTDWLPPGLHPTVPGIVTWLAWDCGDSPWGPFRLVQTRVECRSGNRPRAMLLRGACDSERAAAALTAGWGHRLELAEIDFRRGYDGAELGVRRGDEPILALELRDPVLLPPDVVQFVSSMHPAHTPNGYRLVQCDSHHALTRAERVTPRLLAFDADAWGEPTLAPVHPVSAAIGLGEVTLEALRFVCKPDELAFTGTENVSGR